MNYRHAYHAGNFADVVKHAVLALVIEHLKLKPAPFRVIDTHAGIGLYDLCLRGGAEDRRMARGHRPRDGGDVFAAGGGVAGAVPRRRAAAECRRRH